MNRHFDVVIAGAGMVGATLAALLARNSHTRDLKVAVVDTHVPAAPDEDAPVGLRVSALSRASQRILDAAGAWQLMTRSRVCAYREMRVWDAQPDGSDDAFSDGVHFDCAQLGEADLGHIAENDLVHWSLHQALKDCPGVSVLIPQRVIGFKRAGEALRVELDPGPALHARLVVGCDGASSSIRELAGIECERASYRQRGVVGVVRTALPHQDTAWQRFTPGGPIAFLPLANGDSSVVWSCESQQARVLCGLDDADFSEAISEASNGVLGTVTACSPRASFPLQRLHARNYCAAGIALAGDAAHVVHPLAGQGVNLGLLDAAALAEVLAAALAAGEAPGDLRVLRRYERWRKGENLATLRTMDVLNQLFRADSGLFGSIRRGGLRAVNASPPLKNRFVRYALGLAGELPRVARFSHAGNARVSA